MSNYQLQSHALPVPRQQPPASGAPQTYYTQPSARPKEYPYNSERDSAEMIQVITKQVILKRQIHHDTARSEKSEGQNYNS